MYSQFYSNNLAVIQISTTPINIMTNDLTKSIQNTPCKIQGFKDTTCLVWSLSNEFILEMLKETTEVQVIFHEKSFFSNNSLNCHQIAITSLPIA